jgi:methylmalonyl-CoA mutase
MTRGAVPAGNAPFGWEIRQDRGEADLAALNAAILDDLEGGVNSITIRLDACARAGLDPTDARGVLLAARDGAALYSADDLDAALKGVFVNMIGIGLEPGAAYMQAAAMLAALWERRGVAADAARGCFNADPLAVLARDGALPFPLAEAMTRLADLAAWTSARYSHVRAVRVGTAAYHHAGATATQDLAFSMATALEYLRAMTQFGLDVNRASSQMVFSYAVGCNLFLGIAKLRAARRLFSRVVEAAGGTGDALRMTMHVRPSRRVMTTRDPWVNILRNTACVFAAGAAGADTIGSTPFDATLGEPSALSRRLARNTHHLLMEESRVHQVCDPAGGSYYIERLTDEVAEKAWVILQAIEARGGMARALSEGWIAEQIDTALEPRLHNVATRKEVVLAVSDFPTSSEHDPKPRQVDRDAIITAAKARLASQDAARANTRSAGVQPVQEHADPSPTARAFALAREGASIGAISTALDISGVPATLPAAVHVHPYAEPFEHLRDASDAFASETGHHPRVFLAAIGPVAKRQPRVNFCKNLFETGGFEVLGAEPSAEGGVAEAIDAFKHANVHDGAHVAVICGMDDEYPTLLPVLAPALRDAGARSIVLAGNPGANEAAYCAHGIDRFVFVKCDVVALLTELLKEEGARV